jgi:hypothetical protein
MAVKWRDANYLIREKAKMGNVYKKRLYLNADKTKVVEEGSEEAAWLLGGEGSPVTDEDIEKYGLKKSQYGPADEAVTEQNIVVSGGADSGPAVVEVDRSLDEDADKKTTKKGK